MRRTGHNDYIDSVKGGVICLQFQLQMQKATYLNL